MIIGPTDENTFTKALERIDALVSRGFKGGRIETDLPMFVQIVESPSDIPNFTPAEYKEWAALRGCLVARSEQSVLGDGTCRFSNHRGLGVHVLAGHTFDQVESSIKSLNGQLSSNKLGIAVIGVDIAAQASPYDEGALYLELLSHAMSHRTWGGGRNTRIGAIVLKLCPNARKVTLGPSTYNLHVKLFTYIYKQWIRLPNKPSPRGLVNSLLTSSDCSGQ